MMNSATSGEHPILPKYWSMSGIWTMKACHISKFGYYTRLNGILFTEIKAREGQTDSNRVSSQANDSWLLQNLFLILEYLNVTELLYIISGAFVNKISHAEKNGLSTKWILPRPLTSR